MLTVISSDLIVDDNILIIEIESGFYVQIMTRFGAQISEFLNSWLHEAVCRQRPELRVTVGYMKLCVDRDLNCG